MTSSWLVRIGTSNFYLVTDIINLKLFQSALVWRLYFTMLPSELYDLIYEDALKDDELLEFYNLSKDSKKHEIVAAYILNYFPIGVSKEIVKRF